MRTTPRPFDSMSYARGSDSVFPLERRSLRQHDLDGTHVRRAAILGGHLLRRDADIAHLGVGDEPPADDLGDIDRSRDRPSAGFDDDLPRTSVEIRDDREHVIHRRFLPDVDDARVDRESATTGDEAESGRAVLILSGRASGLKREARKRFKTEIPWRSGTRNGTGPRLGFPFGGGPNPVLRPRGREGPQSAPVDRCRALRWPLGARAVRHLHLAAPVNFAKLF